MKQGLPFLLAASGLAGLVVLQPALPLRLVTVWASIACLWIAASYFGLGAGALGKRSDGTVSPIRLLVLLPYIVVGVLVVGVFRHVLREPAMGRLSDRLYFGRWLVNCEASLLEERGIVAVLDLTAAVPESKAIRGDRVYRNLPLLDGTAPSREVLEEALRWIDDQSRNGAVYVHCAAGHGRAGLVTGAYLLASGEVSHADEAIRRMGQVRPWLHLSGVQRRCLANFAASPSASGPQ